MLRDSSLVLQLLCIFAILPFLASAQAFSLTSGQTVIDRRSPTHRPECEQRTLDVPPIPTAFTADCLLLIKEQVLGPGGPLESSTAWRKEVLRSPSYSIFSTSLGECAIAFGIKGRLNPTTWKTVKRAIRSIGRICVEDKYRGGTQDETGFKVYISTRRVLSLRQVSLKTEFGKPFNSQRRRGTRNVELRRRIYEGQGIEGLSSRPGSLAPPSSPRAGRSQSLPSSPRAGIANHFDVSAPQRQVERSQICAQIGQLDPRSRLSPEQRAKIKLCCKIGVGACSFAVGALIGGVYDLNVVAPLFAMGSVSAFGLATLGDVQEIRNARSSSSSGYTTLATPPHDPSNLVKRLQTLEPRTPPSRPRGRIRSFEVETQAEYRRRCAQRPNPALSAAQAKAMQQLCCKLFTGFCMTAAGAAIGAVSETSVGDIRIPMLPGIPLMAGGALLAGTAVHEFRNPARLPAPSPPSPPDAANLVRRGVELEPRTPPTPRPSQPSRVQHFGIQTEAEYRRLCTRRQNRMISEAQAGELGHLCCKFFTGLCMIGAGSAVSALSSQNSAGIGMLPGIPLIAGGTLIASSALNSIRQGATLPGPRARVSDAAHLVRREAALEVERRTPPAPPRFSPPRPGRSDRLEGLSEAEQRRVCERGVRAQRLPGEWDWYTHVLCCKLFTGLCMMGTGGVVAATSENAKGALPWAAVGGVVALSAASDLRQNARQRRPRPDEAPEVAGMVGRRSLEPWILVPRPRPPPPPPPPTPRAGARAREGERGALDGLSGAERRRACERGVRDRRSNDWDWHTHVLCCKLFTGLCMMGTGGVVAATSDNTKGALPWAAAGGVVTLSAAGDLRNHARLRLPRPRPDEAPEVAAMVKREGGKETGIPIPLGGKAMGSRRRSIAGFARRTLVWGLGEEGGRN